MTNARTQAPPENVGVGASLALLTIPIGVVIVVAIVSIGVFASIAGYVLALLGVWLYRRGSGGTISRTGAWIVTGTVVASILVGMWASMVVSFAHGLAHLGNIGLAQFWPQFGQDFPALLSEDALVLVLVLAFGVIGSFRTLRRAFATSRVGGPPKANFGSTFNSTTITPTTYMNDVDGAPTGSADDKTAPPTLGH
jgi:hypothetical protein